jgi:DNA-binding LytR/AlgR family response regulator
VVENTGCLAATPPTTAQLGLANTRERLRLLYGHHASLRLDDGNGMVTATVLIPATAGEARDAEGALGLIKQLSPDVLFLDIQMPGMTGFDLLGLLEEDVPQVIFTTAFDQHAIRAFEVNALDYLLKPISPDRLTGALRRIEPSRPQRSLSQVFVRDGDR